ncbi:MULTISPECIES: glycosyltransferase family 2 protein [unclassified Guyparkeria]|uniref:glycosyltransferase family 2 protein n=1 Tax=unclassified Guyparkeria TaxID=2626246 RepID=UPI00073396B2|nr:MULTISPECIES: glycosyltransferase family 2 protein [unclassified Guyparkeria]KTG16321.1 hypothetical protein AUR63_05470 [Guyparkeria sp. XI15]OAE85172.1 glycosyl transferase [Guyparkeria sp. WRN-7]
MSIDIVIVNWNSGDQLRNCLKSLSRFVGTLSVRVVVVDNASTDGSADPLPHVSDRPVTLIRNEMNVGFGRACNQGAMASEGDLILFLNPDAEVFDGTLERVADEMLASENGRIGILGVQLMNPDGKVERSCSRAPTLGRLAAQAIGLTKLPGLRGTGMKMLDWDHQSSRDVEQVIGAFFVVRRSVFDALDGFDERFFVYFEEVDLSYRARLAGWRVRYLAEARAFHAGGGTSGQIKARRLYYSLRSRLLYGFKHFPAGRAWLLVGVTLFVEPLSRSVFCLARGDVGGVANTMGGYRLLLGSLPSILRGEGRGKA